MPTTFQQEQAKRRDLRAVPLTPGEGRPPPPAELTEREAEVWRKTVESRPMHYFGAEHEPLLKAYCCHAVMADDLADEIRDFQKRKMKVDKLRREYRSEAALLSSLSAQLRISVRRNPSRAADNQIAQTPKRRLWTNDE